MSQSLRSTWAWKWDPNVESGVLVQDEDGNACLALLAKVDDPNDQMVVLIWPHCYAALMQPPDDEAISGHRLWGHGLENALWAGEVFESQWIAALRQGNRVHSGHTKVEHRYSRLRHYVIRLKGSAVEVVAEEVQVTRVTATSTLEAAAAVMTNLTG